MILGFQVLSSPPSSMFVVFVKLVGIFSSTEGAKRKRLYKFP